MFGIMTPFGQQKTADAVSTLKYEYVMHVRLHIVTDAHGTSTRGTPSISFWDRLAAACVKHTTKDLDVRSQLTEFCDEYRLTQFMVVEQQEKVKKDSFYGPVEDHVTAWDLMFTVRAAIRRQFDMPHFMSQLMRDLNAAASARWNDVGMKFIPYMVLDQVSYDMVMMQGKVILRRPIAHDPVRCDNRRACNESDDDMEDDANWLVSSATGSFVGQHFVCADTL